jgi:hypothetical protein
MPPVASTFFHIVAANYYDFRQGLVGASKKQLHFGGSPALRKLLHFGGRPCFSRGELDFSPAENRSLQSGALAPGFPVLDSISFLCRSSHVALSLKLQTSARFDPLPGPYAKVQAHRSRNPGDATSLRNAISLPRPSPSPRANLHACLPRTP